MSVPTANLKLKLQEKQGRQIILKAKVPAAMSEGFFLTNTDEYNLLHNTAIDRRQDKTQVLYNGIVSYFAFH